MLYERFFSDLPMLQSNVYKPVKHNKVSVVQAWERVTAIETDDSGNVIMVRVEHVDVVPDSGRLEKFEYSYKEYRSRAWITRIMREYAHIAAKTMTPVLVR